MTRLRGWYEYWAWRAEWAVVWRARLLRITVASFLSWLSWKAGGLVPVTRARADRDLVELYEDIADDIRELHRQIRVLEGDVDYLAARHDEDTLFGVPI